MKIIIISITTLFLYACSNAPFKVSGRIVADKNINLNILGHAAPIQLRIYQLRNKKKFLESTYSDLTSQAHQSLKNDLIAVEKIIVRPGQTINYAKQMDKDVRFIGVVAGYRNFKYREWKSVFTVSIFKNDNLVIKITKKSMFTKRSIPK